MKFIKDHRSCWRKGFPFTFITLLEFALVSGHQKTWEDFFSKGDDSSWSPLFTNWIIDTFPSPLAKTCFEPLSGARRHKYVSFFCLRGWRGCGRAEENAHQRYIVIGPWHALQPGRLEITVISGWIALFRKMLMSYNSGKFVVWLWGEFCGLKQINILYRFSHVISMLWLCTECNKTVDVLLEE